MIPAYDEEKLIEQTIKSVPDFTDKIYVVDDGSHDNTFKIIKELAEKSANIIPIKHDKNKGVGAAIISGYKRSLEDKIDISIVIAGDNQMDPTYVPLLLEPIIGGKADYTKGNRLFTKGYTNGMSSWRLFGNSLLTFFTKISSGYWSIMDPQNGYTAVSREVLESLDLDSIYPKYGYCNDLLAKMNVFGFRVLDVAIPARYGNEKSKIRYSSYITKVTWLLLRNFFGRLKTKYMIYNLNLIPFFYIAGMILTPLGIVLGLYSLYYKFILGGDLFARGVLSLLLFFIGTLFLSFAILFDIQLENKK